MSDPTNPDTLAPESALRDDPETLKAMVADAEARAAAAKDAQLRALSELDNTRRRMDREMADKVKYAAEKLLADLIPVADTLELGLQAAMAPEAQINALIEGKEATFKQLMATLEKHGVRVIDPKGEPYNAAAHQAVQMVPSAEVPPNHVLQVVQKGYKLNERVIRPAAVIVAKAP